MGAVVVALDNNLEIIESQQVLVGPMDQWSVHVAKLMRIFYAIITVFKIGHQRPRTEYKGTATILCDSRSALQAIQDPGNKSDKRITHAILQAAVEVHAEGIALYLQWIPWSLRPPGNETAGQLAKDAASPGISHFFRPLLTREKAFIREGIRAQWKREWNSSNTRRSPAKN